MILKKQDSFETQFLNTNTNSQFRIRAYNLMNRRHARKDNLHLNRNTDC